MKISILTVFSELYEPFLRTSLVRKAQENNLVTFDVANFFSHVEPKQRIDAPTFGHGAGMLIKPEVVEKAVDAQEKKHGKAFKIFFSPQGKKLNQNLLKKLAKKIQERGHLILLPARYEGMDARVEEHYADEIISVGDFVLLGGDIPAMMFIEGLIRLIPGVVGKQESVEEESFSGPFVDYPEFTEPVEWKGMKVPDVVRSGNHGAVDVWRKEQAAEKTVKHHFAWLRSSALTDEDKNLAKKYIPPHYVALMHSNVLISEERKVGTTSVTSLDMHDIARSAKTYDCKNFFLVTPIKDQQKMVRRLLDFWQKGEGFSYNRQRFEAVKSVDVVDTIEDVIARIEEIEGKKPLLVATSAQTHGHPKVITYHDQERVWAHDRPVLLVFGTGKGMTDEFLNRCDYLLVPVEGFSEFKHLSVRSAAAIVFDRWLGISRKP